MKRGGLLGNKDGERSGVEKASLVSSPKIREGWWPGKGKLVAQAGVEQAGDEVASGRMGQQGNRESGSGRCGQAIRRQNARTGWLMDVCKELIGCGISTGGCHWQGRDGWDMNEMEGLEQHSQGRQVDQDDGANRQSLKTSLKHSIKTRTIGMNLKQVMNGIGGVDGSMRACDNRQGRAASGGHQEMEVVTGGTGKWCIPCTRRGAAAWAG